MKVKELIDHLQKHDPESEIIVQDYNWYEYGLDFAIGEGNQAKLVVYPAENEE